VETLEVNRPVDCAAVFPPREDLLAWYRPWRIAHPSWFGDDGFSGTPRALDEAQMRLCYPRWCERLDMPAHPLDWDGSIWWRVASSSREVFAVANRGVGMVVMLAADLGRKAILKGEGIGIDGSSPEELRWALQRACLVAPVADILTAERPLGSAPESEAHAFAALRACASIVAPSLQRRIELRFQREWSVAREVGASARKLTDERSLRRACRLLASLWAGALNMATLAGSETDASQPRGLQS
jgi:hypothetical protein